MAENESATRQSGKAVASLVFGLLSFVPLVSILAVVLGHLALSNICKSAGRLGGGQFAVTGLVFGYLGLLWTAVVGLHFGLKPTVVIEVTGPAASLRTLSSAAQMYQSTYSNGYPPSLESLGPSEDDLERYVDWLKGVYRDNTPSCDHAGLIDQVLASGLKGRYKFTYVAQMPDQAKWTPSAEAKKHGCTVAGVSAFTATADPISLSKGLPSYFVDQTGVIRMNKNGPATVNSPPIEGN